MQAITFPNTHVGDKRDMGKPPLPTKTFITEINRWAQALLVLAGMFAIGLPIERRLTTIEIGQAASAKADEKRATALETFNDNWSLLFRANATQLEILLKLRLPKDDRERAKEVLAEIRTKKISQGPGKFANESLAAQ